LDPNELVSFLDRVFESAAISQWEKLKKSFLVPMPAKLAATRQTSGRQALRTALNRSIPATPERFQSG
jgi:hypothetical protein